MFNSSNPQKEFFNNNNIIFDCIDEHALQINKNLLLTLN